MTGRPVRISIVANGRNARAEIQRTGNALTGMSRTVSRAGKIIGGAFAVDAVVRAGAAILKTGDAYTSQLNKIEALTTSSQRAQVGGIAGVAKSLETAKGAYARYGNTVADAASGVTELVKAGQTLPQALKSVNATLVLAKAGEMDVASASAIVATALKTFHLPAKRAGDIANYLANAANISTADVTDLGEALKFVAPVAAKTGVSAQQTAAYLAQLSNAGLNGTIAGEGLRRIMLALQAPVGGAGKVLKGLGVQVFNAQGKVRPFATVMAELSQKLSGLTDQQRAKDLRAIFGLQGVTPATTLLNNVKTIDAYTKGVERAGAAQKLAAANSKGLVGTLRRGQALFVSTAQAGFRAFSPLVDNALRPMLDTLEKNQGSLEAQGRLIAGRVAPAVKSFARALEDSAQAAKGVVDDLKPLTPILGKVVDLAKTAADALDAVPTSVKTLAIEAGIAALVLPKLTGAVGSVTGGFTAGRRALTLYRADLTLTRQAAEVFGPVTRQVADAQGRMASRVAALGTAARNAAGVGGMLALTKSAGEANTTLAALERIGGGAALGFSVAGPWGAAIGGTVGLLATLRGAFGQTADEAKQAAREAAASKSWETAKASVKELTDALHGTVRAYNEVTAAAVQRGFRDAEGKIKPWVQQLMDAGVSMDTLTRATLGQRDAQKLLIGAQGQVGSNLLFRKGAVAQATQELAGYQQQLRALNQTIAQQGHGATTPQLAEQARLNALVASSTKDVTNARNAYKDYASTVNEGNRELGAYGTTLQKQNALERQLRTELGLSKKAYDSLPTEVRTKIEAEGAPQSKTAILDFIKAAKLTPKQIITVLKASGVTVSKKEAHDLGVAYDKVPKQITATAKVVGGAAAVGTASRFGSQAGSAYGAGFTSGIAAWTGRAEFAARAMAGAAHAAALQRLDAHSPSREMIKVGKWFSQGFAIGIRKDASKVLDSVDTLYSKVNKKQRPALKRLTAQYTQGKNGLSAIARAQKSVSEKLDAANQKLADAKQAWQDYHDTVKATVVSFGDITQLGKNSAGNASADAIVKQLQVRTEAAEKYQVLLDQLKKSGLNNTAIQQILDAGVDGGLQTAQAIVAGGPAIIAQINALDARIDRAGGGLGTSMANNFRLAGVNAAQGMVNGLISQQRALERASVRLATAMVAAIKRRLGIRSPSRVFKKIGRYSIQGLQKGFDQDVAQKIGSSTAKSVVRGYTSTPALNAFAKTPSLAAAQATQQFRITLSAAERDALIQGRDVNLTISSANSAGARKMA